ncbi:MAG: hypothetical protein ACK55D_02230 [Synechococcaceae cyanobacterium]
MGIILPAPSEVVALAVVYAAGFATPYLIGMRKQPLNRLQVANFKTGDLFTLTFQDSPAKDATKAEDTSANGAKGPQSISELFVRWIQDDSGSHQLVADAAKLAQKLKAAGICEPKLNAFFEGDLRYLLTNLIIYRSLASSLASCLKLAEMLNMLQAAMLAYCWTLGPSADRYQMAFEIARRIDGLKTRWALVPLDELEVIDRALQENDPWSDQIAPHLLSELDKIIDNAEIHDDLKSFWDEFGIDFGVIYESLTSAHKQGPENEQEVGE